MKYTCSAGLWLIIALIAFSCKHNQAELAIKVEKSFATDAISSGSGLASLKDSVFIIGDDAEYIVKLSVSDTQCRKIELYPGAPVQRIDRSVKHDLESATLGNAGSERFLFAFGSGSISPFRDSLFVLNVSDNKTFKRSLSSLYNAIKLQAGLNKNDLNIEGAAIAGNKLVLFNRGKNLLIVIPWQQFTDYVFDQNLSIPPSFQLVNLSLPIVNNFQIGLSGACALDDDELLFTASLEETNDPTKDGAIKGSYIGILKLVNDSAAKLVSFTNVKTASGEVMLDKLESIEAIETKGKIIMAIAVADNDDGTSKVFFLEIRRD